jgi:hypothetical protein
MADAGANTGAALERQDGRAPNRRGSRAANASGNSHAAVTDPESLAREIERTRSELARTVDAIADRVSPSNAARRAVTRVRSQARRVDPPVAAAVAGALVLGTAAYFAWRGRRRH